MKKYNFISAPTRSELAQSLCNAVISDIKAAIAEKNWASVAFPGGSTPKLFLEQLGKQEVDWSKVYVTLTDERLVAEDHPRSNWRMLESTFFHFGGNNAHKLSIFQTQELQARMPLDVCVLGMGNDMHTASLFPGNSLLSEENDLQLTAEVSPGGELENRITLTPKVLKSAKSVYLLLHGDDKKITLEQASNTTETVDAPVRLIFNSSNPAKVYWSA